MKVSLAQQIDEINRELEQRRQVYPRLIKTRALRESIATFQVARLEAARATLLWLQQHEAEIKTIMAERRAAAAEKETEH